LSNLRLPIEIAIAQGHRVVVAARELDNIPKVLGNLPVHYLQAPFRQHRTSIDAAALPSFTHLLARQCFTNVDELAMHLRVWRNMFDLVRPDLVLFEHSPTALIAAHSYRFKKIVVGNGFTVPPAQAEGATTPFASFPTTSNTPAVQQGLLHDDAEVLKLINLSLPLVGAPALASMHAIYAQADAVFLMTWPVLDQFGARANEAYIGIEPPQRRAEPEWPGGHGPKVFGYLQLFPALETLLQDLTTAQVCALLYIRGLPAELRRKWTGPQLQFADQPVDLSSVAKQSDWVINHGNHSTSAHFLASGVPQLMIPLYQEQLFLAQNLAQEGAALIAYQDQASFAPVVTELHLQPKYRLHAKRLALQCGPYDTQHLGNTVRRVFTLFTNVTM
jgi:hypothetical protein